MRHYEAMYIVNSELTEEQIQPIIDKYSKIVTDMNGSVTDAGKWELGKKRLAYEIEGHREGIYVLMNFESDTDVPMELDRVFRISDDVFRHIIVRQDEDEE